MDYEKARLLRARRLGVLLRDARLAKGQNLKACAEALGLSPSTLRAYEQGERAPSLPELEAIAYHFGLPLEHFWGREVLSDDPSPVASLPLQQLMALRHRIIGAKLRQIREQRGLSLKALAAEAQLPVGRLRSYEYGEKPIPLPELETLTAILQVPLEEFLDQDGPLGTWHKQQKEIAGFLELPEPLRQFVSQPINRPYLELAQRLSEMSVDKLRAVAEGLLEITL